jgi:hypothetical protein
MEAIFTFTPPFLALLLIVFPRRRLIILFASLICLQQMYLLLVAPGVVGRLVIDATTPEQRQAGFVTGVHAMSDGLRMVWRDLGFSILCWPLLLLSQMRLRR